MIMLIGGFLRFYDLGSNPNGLYCDEAATGVDALKILKTGTDLYGNYLPIGFMHHGYDYIEPLYTYLTTLSVWVFDLNIFSTRFMAALFGTLTILTTFLLARRLFNDKVALITSIILALSPWHFHISRIGFRAILAPFFITLGLFFLTKIFKKPIFLIPAAITFSLGLYTYSNIKIILPFIFIAFVLFYWKKIIELFKKKRAKQLLFVSVIIFLLIAIPITYAGVKNMGEKFDQRVIRISVFWGDSNPTFQFFTNLYKHISFDFLFLNGDSDIKHSLPGFGQMLVILLPFVLASLFLRIKKEYWLVVTLFIIGLIPAALTNEALPHALRSIGAVPFLEIIAACGIFFLYKKIPPTKALIKKLFVVIVTTGIIVNSGFYFYNFFFKYPDHSAPIWAHGTKELFEYTKNNQDEYEKIVMNLVLLMPGFTYYDYPTYIYLLFFEKITDYEFSVMPWWKEKNIQIGKYVVCSRQYNICPLEKNNLLVSSYNEEIIGDVKEIIRLPSGEAVFIISEID